jgi:hypothetical protein
MPLEASMDILVALKQEESKLEKQLRGIQGAISVFDGSNAISFRNGANTDKSVTPRRTMSLAARAAISKATKARWAKFRAEKAKKAK